MTTPNARSFIRTLKQEEIYTRQYRDRAELEAHIAEFVEPYDNRLAAAFGPGYRSPEQFENSLRAAPGSVPAAQMSFFRHEETRSLRCGR